MTHHPTKPSASGKEMGKKHIDIFGRCKCDRCGLPIEMWGNPCNQ